MTKTLTEQWREGTLKGGYYYLKMKDGEIYIDHTEYQVGEKAYQWEYSDINEVKEVLAPVPSYDEHNELKQDNKYLKSGIETRDKQIEQLEKRLEIATKALKKYESAAGWGREAFLALKEMEGVK